MAWIKRNLYFVIGQRGCAGVDDRGWFLSFYADFRKSPRWRKILRKQYAELTRLSNLKSPSRATAKLTTSRRPRPGSRSVRADIAKTRAFFQRITPIPDSATSKVSQFRICRATAQYRVAIAPLRRAAKHHVAARIIISPLKPQKKSMIFDPASLEQARGAFGRNQSPLRYAF